jgi:hypothetical protein
MRKLLTLFVIIITLIPAHAFSQFYIEPFAGYQKDFNNHANHFINSGIQAAYKMKNYEFLFQIQKSWPQATHYQDSSFTLNSSLPLYSSAQKELNTSLFSIALGNRFKVAGGKSKNSFFIKFYTGVMLQKVSVNYQYDKTNYVILNPDQTQEIAGVFISGGLEYMRQIGKGRLFFELNFSTPPADNYKYPESFNPVAPVSLNVGYSFKISKK